LDRQDQQDHQDSIQVLRVLTEQEEPVQQDHKVFKELQGILDHKVRLEIQDL
jgi:hypothetical protein